MATSRTIPSVRTNEKRLIRVLGGETLSPPPVWLMRQAGRYLPEYRALRERAGSFLELCLDPGLAAEVTLQPVRRFGFDAAILFSDILVVPYALGQKVDFREGEGPVLEPVTSAEEVARLESGTVSGRLAPVFETVRRVRRELPPEVTLIGFAGAPWTVATYMVEGGVSRDFLAVKGWAYGRPQEFDDLFDLLVEATSRYLIAQVEAGAEAIQLFESWAGLLSESQFRRWSIAPVAEIVRRLKDAHPEIPVIGFPRGAGPLTLDFLAETGIDAVGVDAALPLAFAAGKLQPLGAVQGNLDPHALRAGGAALVEETERILEALGAGPFIFNLGHGVLPDTPPEHVEQLVRLVRDAGS